MELMSDHEWRIRICIQHLSRWNYYFVEIDIHQSHWDPSLFSRTEQQPLRLWRYGENIYLLAPLNLFHRSIFILYQCRSKDILTCLSSVHQLMSIFFLYSITPLFFTQSSLFPSFTTLFHSLIHSSSFSSVY